MMGLGPVWTVVKEAERLWVGAVKQEVTPDWDLGLRLLGHQCTVVKVKTMRFGDSSDQRGHDTEQGGGE